MKVVVVIPTYNEAKNIGQLIEAIFALNVPADHDVHVLVVDDASPDGTGQLIEQLIAQYPQQLHVMHRTQKNGLGAAYIAGFQRALEMEATFVIQMDADFSHSPSYIPLMLEQIANFDVVVGSRYVRGGKLDERWSLGRHFLSWWANSIWVRLILSLKVKDATAGFKCWRRSALETIALQQVRSNGYDFQVEMAYLCEQLGLRALEIPIYFEDRRIGQSKMSIPVKLEAAYRVLEIRWRHRFGRAIDKRAKSPRETT